MAIFKFRNVESGQATPIPEGEFSIGRNNDAYVYVEDGAVSRRHAKLFNLEEGLFIEDAGSGNGTVVGGDRITARTKLAVGDLVRIGSVVFRVDPEMAGEISAGARANDRASMKRDTGRMKRHTERLAGAVPRPRVVKTIDIDKVAIPEVNPAYTGAEAVRAMVSPEPEAPDLMRLPMIRPGLTPLPGAPEPEPEPPQRAAVWPEPAVSMMPEVVPSQEEASSPLKETPPLPSPSVPSRSGLIFFLAGMATGLLLGLLFAWIFLEMGGKGAALP